MADFDQLGPLMYEYRKSPLLVGIAEKKSMLYFRAARYATETECPLFETLQLEDIILSHAMVKRQSCSSKCEARIWRFEVPLDKGRVPPNLNDAVVHARYTIQECKLYDKAKEAVMGMARQAKGDVTYAEACEYMKENKVQVPLDIDEVKPALQVTEYFLDNVLQARTTYICALLLIDEDNEYMNEVNEVYQWVQKRGLDGLQLFEAGKPNVILDKVDPPQQIRERFKRKSSSTDN